ncbi:MAG: hypothetical protein QF579_05425, partial [Dehalococcoidia bacterium]|nr:hypothetical protein [Dehalococcoidia bacterium]
MPKTTAGPSIPELQHQEAANSVSGKPVFVVFEGGEGSGKSTQAKALSRHLQRLSLASTVVRDPGGTAFGKRMERWLKNARDIPTRTELLLFAAARALLTEEIIRPALKAG